jgi:hypothetical protein
MVFFWSLYNIVPPLMFIIYSTCDGKTPGFERFVGICCVASYVVAAGGPALQRPEARGAGACAANACRPAQAALLGGCAKLGPARPCCAGGIIAMWLVPSEYDFGKILDTALLFYDSQR